MTPQQLQHLRDTGHGWVADEIERMQVWLEGDCNCPCCDGVRECSDGCTFAIDAPVAAQRMAGAREALYGVSADNAIDVAIAAQEQKE